MNRDRRKRSLDYQPSSKSTVAIGDVVLSTVLQENINSMKALFGQNDTLITRTFESRANPQIQCGIVFSDGMVNSSRINENIIRPITLAQVEASPSGMLDTLMAKVLLINESKKTDKVEDIVQGIVYGDTIFFVEGCAEALVLNTKGWAVRAIAEPDAEKVLRGPREGFTEALLTNLSMIRRRIRSEELQMKYKTLGTRTKTNVCVCYIEGLVNPDILAELYRRLDKFSMDAALDSNYLVEFIKDAPMSFFKTIGSTERPDIVTGKLLEGRVALLVDGSPVAITLPHLMIENFQSNEDYYVTFFYASFMRILRIAAFIITIGMPAFYISVVTYNQELLPTPLIMSISAARHGVPFPTIVEAFGMLLVFEMLKESGVRTSSMIGQALSIVGALVVGQAAVEAKIVSAPVIIVIAFTGISGMILPRLTVAIIILRYTLVFLSSMFGIYGLLFGMMGLLIHILNLRSFGIAFVGNLSLKFQEIKDTVFRAPWWDMILRPNEIAVDRVRSKSKGGNRL